MSDVSPTGSDVFLSFLAYLPVLNLIPLFKKEKHRFLSFHARQGLFLFSAFLVSYTALLAVSYLFLIQLNSTPEPIKVLLSVLVVIVGSAYLIIVLLMLVSVLQQKMVMLPVLGEYAGEK